MMITFPVNKIDEMFSSGGGYLYNQILNIVHKYNMSLLIEQGVLVGFSGGADSVLLLCFLYEYRRRNNLNYIIVSCHINHLIRGAEADRDLNFAKEFSEHLNIPFISYDFDVPNLSKTMGLGIEETARNVRYSKFAEITNGREDLSTIAVAHNASDNLETVLFNLMRGCGLAGACGISPIRDNIIRPLIGVSKTEVELYLNKFTIPYVIDSTNCDTEYTRNYIRHEITPKLKRLARSPEDMISRFTYFATQDNEFIKSYCDSIYESAVTHNELSVSFIRSCHSAVSFRILARFIHENTGFIPESKHIELVLDAIKNEQYSLSLCGGFSFVIHHGVCLIINTESAIKDTRIFSINEGMNKIEDYESIVYFGDSIPASVEGFDLCEKISLPRKSVKGIVYLRFRLDGDSYKYGGVTHKLKKVFNDRNIPPYERDRIPVLCDDLGILWVPGLKTRDFDSKPNVSEMTNLVLYIKNTKNKKIYTARQR